MTEDGANLAKANLAKAVEAKTVDVGRPVAVDLGSRTINVRNCASCDAKHDALLTRPMNGETLSPFTHIYTCPTTGDPVPLALYDEAGELVEISSAILRALVVAGRSGRSCIAVWWVEGDRVQMKRLTANFPTVDFRTCLKMLDDDFTRECGPPPARPLADGGELLPMVDLFGTGAGGAK